MYHAKYTRRNVWLFRVTRTIGPIEEPAALVVFLDGECKGSVYCRNGRYSRIGVFSVHCLEALVWCRGQGSFRPGVCGGWSRSTISSSLGTICDWSVTIV
jgi:hypothetical protein